MTPDEICVILDELKVPEAWSDVILIELCQEIERRTLERAAERCMTILGYPPREYYAQAIRALMEPKNETPT